MAQQDTGRKAHISIRVRRSDGHTTAALSIRNSQIEASLEIEITHWLDHPTLAGTVSGYSTVYTQTAMPVHPLVMARMGEGEAQKMASRLLMPLTGGYGSDEAQAADAAPALLAA